MNMYWKYQKYHWKSWLSAALFSLFCGPVVILINFIFLSIAYCYDRSRAEKEMKKNQYHSEIIDAINKRNWPASVEYSKDESVENIKGPWGEA